MDIREIVQTVVGVLILKPDQILLNSALGNSVLFAGVIQANQLGTIATVLGLIHTLSLILGFGLILGISLGACTAIAFFVALGAGAGLFEAGQLLNIFGGQIAFVGHPLDGVANSLVVDPFLSDFFIIAPLIVLAAGLFRWHYSRKNEKQKAISEMDSHLRQYCTACGVHVTRKAKKCESCGAPFSKEESNYCTDCGRRVPSKAEYCGFCGAEILKSTQSICHSCKQRVALNARHCFYCGSRLARAKKDEASFLVGS